MTVPAYHGKVSKALEDFRRLDEKLGNLKHGSHDPRAARDLERLIDQFESSSMDLSAQCREILKLHFPDDGKN